MRCAGIPYIGGRTDAFLECQPDRHDFGPASEHRPEHVFRAMLEANCYATRQICELLEDGGGKISTVIASGGGSGSDLWLQIKANVLKRPICRSSVKESTLYGAFLLAQRACGIVPEKRRAVQIYPAHSRWIGHVRRSITGCMPRT